MEFFMNEHTLYFSSPARCFEEAFPLGNGRLGIMLYGGTDKERLSLNEDTLWSGHPGQNPVPPRAKEAFVNARALAMAGEYQKAQTLLEQDFTASWTQIYLPLGHLTLTFGHSAPQHYRRVLDLQTAVASVSYQQNGIQYQRECFVSAPDNVMALTIHCSKPGALSFSLETETPLCVTQQEVQQDILLTVGRCPSFGSNYVPAEQAFRYDGESISFAQGVKIITQEGTTHSVAVPDRQCLTPTAPPFYLPLTPIIIGKQVNWNKLILIFKRYLKHCPSLLTTCAKNIWTIINPCIAAPVSAFQKIRIIVTSLPGWNNFQAIQECTNCYFTMAVT